MPGRLNNRHPHLNRVVYQHISSTIQLPSIFNMGTIYLVMHGDKQQTILLSSGQGLKTVVEILDPGCKHEYSRYGSDLPLTYTHTDNQSLHVLCYYCSFMPSSLSYIMLVLITPSTYDNNIMYLCIQMWMSVLLTMEDVIRHVQTMLDHLFVVAEVDSHLLAMDLLVMVS